MTGVRCREMQMMIEEGVNDRRQMQMMEWKELTING